MPLRARHRSREACHSRRVSPVIPGAFQGGYIEAEARIGTDERWGLKMWGLQGLRQRRDRPFSSVRDASGRAVIGLVLVALFVTSGSFLHAEARENVVEVELANFSFSPNELTVPAGTTVRFINRDLIGHDVVQAVPDEVFVTEEFPFQSPQIMPGESWEFTFNDPGEYPVLCTVGAHFLLGMTATIVVE